MSNIMFGYVPKIFRAYLPYDMPDQYKACGSNGIGLYASAPESSTSLWVVAWPPWKPYQRFCYVPCKCDDMRWSYTEI